MNDDYYTVGQNPEGLIVLSEHKYGQGVYTKTFTIDQAESILQLLRAALRSSYESSVSAAIDDVVHKVLVELEYNGYPRLSKELGIK